jgi:ankyrin repeat protein
MKNLLDAADNAYLKKTHILSNKASYNYTVKVPHEQITKTYQNLTKTINIPYSETNPNWGATSTWGQEKYNIYEDIYILCTAPEVQNAVKQLIISKVGLETIELPTQSICINKGISHYQFDSSGNKIPHMSQPEAWNGYLRFFYKVNEEVTHKKITYTYETRFDEERYNRDIARADQNIATIQSNINDIIILSKKEKEVVLLKEKLNETQVKFKSQVESMSAQQRAYIFAETFGVPSKEFVLKVIQDVGFDTGSLGFYAITKNNKALVEIALHNKADFGSYHYDKKSLIQHLVKSGNKELIDFVLSLEGQDFGTTLLTAINQDDIETLRTVLFHNPYLLSSLHDNGYSLLHVAISLNKTDVIKAILALDTTLIDIKSSDLESPFEMAIRQKSHDIIKLLMPFVNFNQEIQDLIDKENIEMLQLLKTMEVNLTEDNILTIEQSLVSGDINLGQEVQDLDLLMGQIHDFNI